MFGSNLHVLNAPADDGEDLSGVDRGDDFIPTEGDAPAKVEDVVDPKTLTESEETEEKVEETEETEEEEEEKPAKPAKKIMIPKDRFDAAQKQHRDRIAALEAQLAAQNKATEQAAKTLDLETVDAELDALSTKLTAAIADNDAEKAARLLKEIRAKERAVALDQAQSLSKQARAAAIEDLRYEALTEHLEEAMPQINPDHELYDQEVVNEVLLLLDGFLKSGLTRTKALQKAASYVMKSLPAVEEEVEEEEVKPAKKPITAERTAAAKKAAAAAAKAQPAAVDKAGLHSDKNGAGTITAAALSDADLDALPKSVLAKMRGDFL